SAPMSLSCCWFVVFVGVWWLPLMLVVAEDQQGGDCSAQKCGNVSIFDPFWLTDKVTGRSCGSQPYQDFDVSCLNNSYPALRAIPFNLGFKILNISYEQRSLYAIDLGKLDALQAGNSCQALLYNTSVKLNRPFRIAPVNLNLILYNCTEKDGAAAAARRDIHLELTSVRCGNQWEVLARAGVPHDATGNYSNYALKGCAAVVVPVPGSSAGASASDYKQLFNDGFLLTWDPPLRPSILPRGEKRGKKIMLIGMTSAAATFLFASLYVLIMHRKGKRLWFLLCKKTSSNTEKNYEAMIVSYGSLAPKRFMYSEVMKITSSRNNQLGKGGYGVVFKGRLHDGRLVAVKFLHDCKGNGDEFVNEVMSIGRTSHVNVVSLFGFCLEGSKRALIYEYMPNGSLDMYIYSENPKEILGWERLYAIAIGIARGLEYLHHSCNTRIVHFDIKPQNILLDKDFNPKIADFGLAKLCHTKESNLSMTGARGTIGFIAPEVHSRTFGVVSTKSDVYSYGMMLLEMVGGRRNVKSIVAKSSEKYFPDWIYDHFAQDDGLQACEVTGETEEIARKMTLIGLWCVQILPAYRPTITKVLEMFERSSNDMDMPPKQNFSGLLESSAHNMDVQSSSSTRSEEISLVNSKILQKSPTL
uniref:Protein kinase domain-containing protein n=2 Tax=Aegilops tauschii subsp. strangulata TaxID=200361 RepID=A0A453DUY9_AEGTS